jgi:cysteinyl-tRNA synthetase
MQLKLYNTLNRKKEPFTPLDPSNVRKYVCGPTVYARPHIGNARSVVVYDVLYRLLKHLYPKVTYVRNITDVDDKINTAAIERKITIQALTQEVTGWFHEDMDALYCERPTIEPRATEHINEMIAIIKKLIANGFAYVAQGHVLFDVMVKSSSNSWHYGILSGRVQEDLRAGARIEVESYKRNAGDFVLWKPTDPEDDPSSVFDSPWGKGRPGWHIECSAMSSKYLGNDFDIHGGGADLMFPHHENEIAQSCCAHPGTGFARLWVHNGFLTVNGEKMSKSLRNFITVRDLLDKGVLGEDVRLALLMTKYNEPLDWNEKLISDAKKTLDKWYRQIPKEHHSRKMGDTEIPASAGMTAFIDALCDDMNFPKAFSLMHTASPEELHAMGKLLGFFNVSSEERAKGAGRQLGAEAGSYKITGNDVKLTHHIAEERIDALISARTEAKKAKNWKEADRIRDELKAQGIILEDRPDGTTDWRRA